MSFTNVIQLHHHVVASCLKTQCKRYSCSYDTRRGPSFQEVRPDTRLACPECTKRATSVNVQLPCLQEDLRTGSISRDTVNFPAELCRRRSGTFTEAALVVPPESLPRLRSASGLGTRHLRRTSARHASRGKGRVSYEEFTRLAETRLAQNSLTYL